jgi:hypothetical protein
MLPFVTSQYTLTETLKLITGVESCTSDWGCKRETEDSSIYDVIFARRFNRSGHPYINERTNERTNELTNEWMNE